MDGDSQVEEFDSSSSESSDPNSSEAEPVDSGDEEEVGSISDKGTLYSRKRKRDKKRHTAGLRKTLRTHYESIEDFNPEARSAQSAELERIRRLELQQSILSLPPHTSSQSAHTPLTHSQPAHPITRQKSPEMVVVDLSHKATPPKDMIVIDSDSSSDSGSAKPSGAKVKSQSSSVRAEKLHRKYDDPSVPRPDGRVVVNVGHVPSEPDVLLAPQIARVVKPHQVGGVPYCYKYLQVVVLHIFKFCANLNYTTFFNQLKFLCLTNFCVFRAFT